VSANLVGDGIKPSLIEDANLRAHVQKLWLAWTDEADADGLLVPMQVQLLLAEVQPFEMIRMAANGNRIQFGIVYDAMGRQVAVRVPAADLLHIYRLLDAVQSRCLPHVAPAIVRLFLLDQCDDAELDRNKTAAMFAGFIIKTAIASLAPS